GPLKTAAVEAQDGEHLRFPGPKDFLLRAEDGLIDLTIGDSLSSPRAYLATHRCESFEKIDAPQREIAMAIEDAQDIPQTVDEPLTPLELARSELQHFDMFVFERPILRGFIQDRRCLSSRIHGSLPYFVWILVCRFYWPFKPSLEN